MRAKNPSKTKGEPALLTPMRLFDRDKHASLSSSWEELIPWRKTAVDRDALTTLSALVERLPNNARHYEAVAALDLYASVGRPPDRSVTATEATSWINLHLVNAKGSCWPEAAAITARIASGLSPQPMMEHHMRRVFSPHQKTIIACSVDQGTCPPAEADKILRSDYGSALVPWMIQRKESRSLEHWHGAIQESRDAHRICLDLLSRENSQTSQLLPDRVIGRWLLDGCTKESSAAATRWLRREGIEIPDGVRARVLEGNGLANVARDCCEHYDLGKKAWVRMASSPAAAADALAVLTAVPQRFRIAMARAWERTTTQGTVLHQIAHLDKRYPEERGNYIPVFAAFTHDLPDERHRAIGTLVGSYIHEITEPWMLQAFATLIPDESPHGER